jgi:hypothetical protein
MFSINFANLRRKYPHLAKAFVALENWAESNQRIRHFDPVRIAKSHPDLALIDLSLALNMMVEEGTLKRSYSVRAPDRTLAIEGFFDSVDKIPPVLHGTGDHAFKRKEGEVVTLYLEAAR